jgi:hypothetical protein
MKVSKKFFQFSNYDFFAVEEKNDDFTKSNFEAQIKDKCLQQRKDSRQNFVPLDDSDNFEVLGKISLVFFISLFVDSLFFWFHSL